MQLNRDLEVIDEFALFPRLALTVMVVMFGAVSLIALNALIAFMGDSFNKVAEKRNANLAREKASLIVELYSK